MSKPLLANVDLQNGTQRRQNPQESSYRIQPLSFTSDGFGDDNGKLLRAHTLGHLAQAGF